MRGCYEGTLVIRSVLVEVGEGATIHLPVPRTCACFQEISPLILLLSPHEVEIYELILLLGKLGLQELRRPAQVPSLMGGKV